MNKSLTVYKASAGSGKTFTLAVEYISLLIKNPEDYQHILAVTFTNKATQEMKTRILSQLYGIANSLKSSDSYLREVQRRTGLTEQVIRSNAGIALSLLIHRYSDFRIQTIDAFFQLVLRNLARELNLTANLRVDLNDVQVERKAVDRLIDGLEQGQDILRWIRDYIDRNIEDDLNWNVIGKIKDFGRNLFKDFYKEHERELDALFKNDEFFDQYTKQLRGMQHTLKTRLNKAAEDILEELRGAGVDEAGLLRNHLYGYILKQSKMDPAPGNTPSYVATCIEAAEKWPSGKCPAAQKSVIIALASEKLCDMLAVLENERLSGAGNYQSARLVLSHLSQLRLLHAIADTMNRINKDANRFMLSNTQSLLRKLIGESDTPFIFEKIGTRLKHIMIDEFQDTGMTQWSNFSTLLENCMAQAGSRNLIVGDVKQSIYRWRQGDWQLLGNIHNRIRPEYLDIRPLDRNYRSEENIVDFNNVFFDEVLRATVAGLEDEGISQARLLSEAYSDLHQEPVRTGGKGSVRIALLPEGGEYKEQIIDHLVQTVEELLDNGHRQNEIAILLRSKGVIQDIAETFLRHFGNRVSIVSDEAFRLDASLALTVLIDALKLLVNPEDNLTRGELVKLYRQQVLADTATDTELLVSNADTRAHLDKSLPEEFVTQPERLLQLPIIDLIDRLVVLFSLDRLDRQSAYLCTFYDTLDEYLRDNPADLNDFLEQWSDNLSSKTIQSDEIEGIRIITIHASKGLEFPNVIIPFCDWQLEQKDTLWCPADGKPEPFNRLPIVPVDFAKSSMLGTVFEPDYKEEHFQKTLDNLNLLYVAFTRAGSNLFISGKRAKKADSKLANRSRIIEATLPAISQALPGSVLAAPDDTAQPISFQFGILAPPERNDLAPAGSNPFTAPIETQLIQIRTFPQAATFRQSNRSRDFVAADTDAPSNQYIKLGNVLHQLFATIRTEADIVPQLQMLRQEGVIYNEEITSLRLSRHISQALANPIVKDWFSPRWRIFNECTILQYDPALERVVLHRPDRVMTDGEQFIVVDFKFGSPRPDHPAQVRRYMNLLSQMGHTNLKGFLWYVMRDEIREVPLS